jgi:hypothetical protein
MRHITPLLLAAALTAAGIVTVSSPPRSRDTPAADLAAGHLALAGKTHRGPRGPRGRPGPAGPRGLQGAKGDTGAPGAKGDAGPKGDTGATGQQGPKGDAGSALAYAHVFANGSLDPARTRNVLSVTRPTAGSQTGRYCIDLLSGIVPHNVVATLERVVDAAGNDLVTDDTVLATITPNAQCAGAEDASVLVFDTGEGREDEPFYVVFN